MKRADLHIHTRASDGQLSPAEVVRTATAARLDVIAITDHDTVGGLAEAIDAGAGGPVRVITGVELSTHHGDDEVHVLGYHIRPDAASLLRHEHGALGRRLERAREMVRLLQGQGIPIEYEDVLRAAGPDARAIGRPHVARALVEGRHVRSVGQAFERYLADGGIAFVRSELPSVRDAIDIIRDAGGVAVWAHPNPEHFERDIRTFAGWGLAGVECFRPNTLPADAHRFRQVAAELGLFPTGGSDWHGPHRARLGDFAVLADEVRELLEAGVPG
ncbi:MAG TPA: PHP domain-containing protein [Longimicrobium sp.]|nr:PHP domain-containing protein [Longimicrobium sp.]